MPPSAYQCQIQAFSERIEHELVAGQLNFPTVMDLSLRIKQLADAPDTPLDAIARLLKAEPVISAKAVRLANTVGANPYHASATSVDEAVRRIGLDTLLGLAFAVSAEQLAKDLRTVELRLVATGLWMHTVDVACWAQAIARETSTVKPETALFAGMMTDIGLFFLLARVADYPAVTEELEHFAEFAYTWSIPVGRAILESFRLPEHVLDAYPSRERLYGGTWPPASLSDTLLLATLVAQTPNPFDTLLGVERPTLSQAIVTSNVDEPRLNAMLAAAETSRNAMLDVVRS